MYEYRAIGIDIECSKLPYSFPWQKEAYLVNVGMCDVKGNTEVVWFNHQNLMNINQSESVERIKKWVEGADCLVGHNIKFDLNWLRHIGIDVDSKEVWCTQIGQYLLSGQRDRMKSLSEVSKKYGITPKIDRVKLYWESGYNTDEIPVHILSEYLKQDCFNTLAIYQRQLPLIKRAGLSKIASIEMSVCKILSEMETTGMKVDRQRSLELIREYGNELSVLDESLKEIFGFDINLSSGDDLSAGLYGGIVRREGTEEVSKKLKSGVIKKTHRKCVIEKEIKGLGFKPLKGSETKKEGYYQTNKNILSSLKARNKKQKKCLELLKQRSNVAKAYETFKGKSEGKGLINPIQHDDTIHGGFNQTITKSGRLSSSNPNMQNLQAETSKQIFVPRYDWFVEADFSQLEVVGAALCSQDKTLCGEIREGIDFHSLNASKFFGGEKDRKNAKIFKFRMIYGGSAYGFFMDNKMPSYPITKWKRITEEYYAKYSGLQQWQNQNFTKVQKKGELRNLVGRRLKFVKYPTKHGTLEYSKPQVCNIPVQSFASDIVKLALVVVKKKLKQHNMRSLLVCTVHDSILFDVPKEELATLRDLVLHIMCTVPKYMKVYYGLNFNLPLKGECSKGKNYGDLEEY